MGGCTVYSSPKVEPFYQVPHAIYPDFPENLQATCSLYRKGLVLLALFSAVLIQVPFFREIYETSVNKLFTVVRQKPTHIFPYNFLKGATLYLRFIKQWNGETFN